MTLQACLFSESSVVETGLWCELTQGIDPLDWARLCRFLGQQTPTSFAAIARKVLVEDPLSPSTAPPHHFGPAQPGTGETRPSQAPLLSLGPSGIGGRYQTEFRAK
jgi:hypothetical protein